MAAKPRELGVADPPGQVPATPGLEVTYYTDPLCCWSWAFEPHWRRLHAEFGDHLVWRYRMAGMIASWQEYRDPLNAVSRPAQMGPIWREAAELSGLPIAERIWVDDPPASSYPACLAVKAAELQSREAADLLLQRLRRALMEEGRNIARRTVILEVGDEAAREAPAILDASRLRAEFSGDEVLAAFRDDIKEARYLGIGRFPTLTLRCLRSGAGVVVVGYRPYEALLAAVGRVAPDLVPA